MQDFLQTALMLPTLTIDKIRNERRVELAFEDHRVWDLKRWRIAHTIWTGNTTNPDDMMYALYPYRVIRPGDASRDGKYVFEKIVAPRFRAPRFFQMNNYYSTISQTVLNNNPLIVPNPSIPVNLNIMKIKNHIYLLFAASILMFAGCKYDNYTAPQSVLSGTVGYQGAGIGVRSNAVQLELWQRGWQLFSKIPVYVQQDGTYKAILFDGDYKLTYLKGVGPWGDQNRFCCCYC